LHHPAWVNNGKHFAKTGRAILINVRNVPCMPAKAESASDVGRSGTCRMCGQQIPGDRWFARFKLGDERAVFCRPHCVYAFLEAACFPQSGLLEWTPDDSWRQARAV
jgi:hypothetical protein